MTCACGFRFCFQCADYDIGDHAPAECDDVTDWIRRANKEAENLKWLMDNTKK